MKLDALKKTGKFTLTSHAKDRLRQRLGIESSEAQTSWANETIATSQDVKAQGNKTVYVSESYEIVCDGLRVITVKPVDNVYSYVSKFKSVLKRETTKLLTPKERLLRKAEVKVAELTLNYLKAKNPNTKAIINERLVSATDEKQRLADEIYAIKKAAGQYGVAEL